MDSQQMDTWTQPSKRGRSPPPDDAATHAKLHKQSDHWLNPTTTSNRFAALQEEEPDTPQPSGKEPMPKPPPIYISNVTKISLLIQLLEQIAPSQYDLKALANHQIKVQPKTSDAYRNITKALIAKQTQFHTYQLKEERPYRVVLKNMHYSIDPEEIKAEVTKLGHTVLNIWNAKNYRTKQPLSMFFLDLQTAPNNKDIYQVEHLHQCRIRFEPPCHTRDIVQCANCQRYEKFLSSQTQMCEMRRGQPDETLPTQRKLQRCTMCPM
jgi:hypothetical protein